MQGSYAFIVVICLYTAALFIVALWTERTAARGRNPGDNPIVYSLSLAVYCTAWTFYGSVESVSTSGTLFLTIFMGPTMGIILWWIILRKLIRLKNRYNFSSIADLVSIRYDKSPLLAVVVTLVCIAGIIPYISLQLKSIISTFNVVFPPEISAGGLGPAAFGPAVTLLMIVFAILFGARRVTPSERHQGIVTMLAVESIVKLTAMIAVGLFVSYFLFDGFADIFRRVSQLRAETAAPGGAPSVPFITWASYLVLSMSAIMFLPRQFHLSVIENFHEKHIRTAMWLLPLYMFVINLFIIPIAYAGVLNGLPSQHADIYVLLLPMESGVAWLTHLVFIGGFSAAMGMVIISTMTLSTMVTNHILLPGIERFAALAPLRRRIRELKWFAIAGVLIAAYLMETIVFEKLSLVSIGMMSFVAVLQFAPPVIGGLFWRRGNRRGALAGIAAGAALWFYIMIFPLFAVPGWIPGDFLEHGPFGINLLSPAAFMGITGLDRVSLAVICTLFANTLLYVLGSLLFEQSDTEREIAYEFTAAASLRVESGGESYRRRNIDAAGKIGLYRKVLSRYMGIMEADAALERCLADSGVGTVEKISILELHELNSCVEKVLSGMIGAAAAHSIVVSSGIFTEEETASLAEAYGEMIAQLNIGPMELKKKFDYYREREELVYRYAEEMQDQIESLRENIVERKRIEEALRREKEFSETFIRESPVFFAALHGDGRIMTMNNTLLHSTGYTLEEVTGMDLAATFFPERERELIRKRVKILNSVPVQAENALLKRNGEEILIEWRGAPVFSPAGSLDFIICVGIDVTERNRAVERMKELERIVNRSPAVAFLWRNEEGWPVEFVSSNIEQFGYLPGDLISGEIPFYSIIHPDDLERVVREINGSFSVPGLSSFVQYYRLVKKSGEVCWIEDMTWLRKDAGGNVTHFQGVVFDITEQKRAQEALEDSERRLRALSRKVITTQEEERKRLSRELHDELGQQMTAMRWGMDRIKKVLETPDELKLADEMSNIMDQSTSHLKNISRGLRPPYLDDLGLSLAINVLVNEFSQINEVELDYTVELENEENIDPTTGIIVYRILQECLTNITKYAGAENVSVRLASENEAVILEVSDDGAGFDPGTIGEKKGLGLVGMRERASLCGGSIEIESAPGKGTSVKFRAPYK